jgi:hypothetical protein
VVIRRSNGVTERFDLPRGYDVNTMYMDEIRYFLECVGTRQSTFCQVREGIAALSLALAAKEIGAREVVRVQRS